jgi:hypothetical protein
MVDAMAQPWAVEDGLSDQTFANYRVKECQPDPTEIPSCTR